MNAVADLPRTKLLLIERTIEQHENELADVRRQLAELPVKEHAARVAALDESPTKSGSRPGKGAYDVLAEKRELEDREVELEKDLAAAKDVRALRAKEHSIAALAPHIADAKRLRKSHLAAWQKLGEQFAEMLDTVYGDAGIITSAEELDALSLANESVVQECEDEKVKADALAVFGLPVQPFPVSLAKVFELLISAACDPSQFGYREGAARLDGADLLVTVIPDCRGQIRTPVLSGRVDKCGQIERAGENFSSGLQLGPAR